MARPAEMTPLDSRGQRPKLLQDYPLLAAMNQAEMTGNRTSIGALLLRCCLIKLDGTRHVVSLMSVDRVGGKVADIRARFSGM